MSKTVEIQIEKSRGLVEGLRRHVREMGERGVTNDEINARTLDGLRRARQALTHFRKKS